MINVIITLWTLMMWRWWSNAHCWMWRSHQTSVDRSGLCGLHCTQCRSTNHRDWSKNVFTTDRVSISCIIWHMMTLTATQFLTYRYHIHTSPHSSRTACRPADDPISLLSLHVELCPIPSTPPSASSPRTPRSLSRHPLHVFAPLLSSLPTSNASSEIFYLNNANCASLLVSVSDHLLERARNAVRHLVSSDETGKHCDIPSPTISGRWPLPWFPLVPHPYTVPIQYVVLNQSVSITCQQLVDLRLLTLTSQSNRHINQVWNRPFPTIAVDISPIGSCIRFWGRKNLATTWPLTVTPSKLSSQSCHTWFLTQLC